MINFQNDLYICICQHFAGQIQIYTDSKNVAGRIQIQIGKNSTVCQDNLYFAACLCIPSYFSIFFSIKGMVLHKAQCVTL